ncbi:IspD/TarI family cytidylyltransferase [Vibrio campbellii]|uniref:IspD/TarI family cytidylyltransferase n=1 Tax=Vibrio campbellii TaxID=680 RepID=UPI00068199F9|nr:IspD/TarI family cytidylyltransferase [Vibrio campbellii]AQM67097.1 Putative 2-C-methyl-D-erythritol 4-phosphate cytidylyltransferase 2 [Vibrio campbellii]AYO09214.1 2-C-methyl-D-erythritol 4-phosphate cytidylyltransferase [Vibrio campbellii]OPH50283.1 2-C-methyl-D-erythritol 4-phosphate cytidylyltransferase [Vibrio campbellii]
MNVALIFAGGVGTRMQNSTKPKQFLELYNKPVVIYTLEKFEENKNIDAIVVVCVEPWIDYLRKLLFKFDIQKVKFVIPGGETGQESIFNGLCKIEEEFDHNSVVLIHDGVRPLINDEIINRNIEAVKSHGSAITTCPPVETFVLVDSEDVVKDVHDRSLSRLAKAPQSFYLRDILKVHRQAREDCYIEAIDSCSLMTKYGYDVRLVSGISENIKITSPIDFFIFKAIIDTQENLQVFG